MLYYEYRKLFSKRKGLALLIFTVLVICFFTVILSQITSIYPYSNDIAFPGYLPMYWTYAGAILCIIIFAHTPLFAIEDKNAMSQVLRVSQLGREHLAKTKTTLSLIITNVLTALFIATSLLGYAIAFNLDFEMPITDYNDIIYTLNSSVETSGGVLLTMLVSFVFTANFAALLSMYLSAKLKNAHLTGFLLILVYFIVFVFGMNLAVGVFFTLSPMGNYILSGSGLKVLFEIGAVPITAHIISLLVTLILIFALTVRIKKLYNNR